MNRLLLLLAALAVSGTPRAQTLDYGRRLAAVRSDTAAQQLFWAIQCCGNPTTIDSVRAGTWQYMRCLDFQLPDDSTGNDDPCVRYRIGASDLLRHADFNQDGRPDLFAVDRWNRAWCLLNQGPALPLPVSLEFRQKSERGCNQFSLISLGGRPAVVHFYVAPRSSFARTAEIEPEVWQDTLVYHAGAFVEYNAHPGPQWPTRLDLTFSEGRYHSKFSVAADLRTGQVTGHYDRDIQLTGYVGPLSFQLGPGPLDQLRQQAAYLDPARLRPLYDTKYAPTDTAWVALHYPGRPAVRVADYGTFGTHSLGQLYYVLTEACAQARTAALEERRQRVRPAPPRPAGLPAKP